ncbi:GHKL domain-containing protein [Ruminiclostridium herbifermentans]|uniref:GHKL domain-containing protein n=1 Tax=Ruminiclostridium herbifermentans TaxID=2488810 RepID=A0A4U7JL60_9FIRM|nr:GHKL domain-containing protein [Ruminiclostridium herbifermentans]QNU67234.1 GHKL domain-containing protein [Ruminiclostridium herbifermentans]
MFVIANIVFTTLSALLIYLFLHNAYDLKVTPKRRLFFITIFSVTNTLLSSSTFQIINSNFILRITDTILLFVLSTLIIKYSLNTTYLESIFSFCIMGIGLGFGNAISILIFSLFNFKLTITQTASNISLYIAVNFAIYAVAGIFVSLVLLFKKKTAISNKTIYYMVCLVFLIFCIYIGIYFFQNSFEIRNFIIMLVIALIFCMFTIWYILSLNENEKQKIDLQHQKFYNESLGNALQDLRRFKHDQVNHLSVINTLLHTNKYTEATGYLDEIIGTAQGLTTTAIYNIKNAALFGIIYSKMNSANKLGITFDLQVVGVVESIPNIKISELCEIIGIHLDNAIEATQNSNDKIIEMFILGTDTDIQFTIKNSCSIKPIMSKIKEDGYSTKGNDRGHGLAIVENILRKYSNVVNIIQFDNDDSKFVQIIKIKKGI